MASSGFRMFSGTKIINAIPLSWSAPPHQGIDCFGGPDCLVLLVVLVAQNAPREDFQTTTLKIIDTSNVQLTHTHTDCETALRHQESLTSRRRLTQVW